jgi:RNA polymerase sigma factor (sigma-70 family)
VALKVQRTDVELVALAGRDDRVAQGWLVGRLIGRVQRLTLALVTNSADASDASQVSLMEILRSASTFRGQTSLECWADEIVRRTTRRIVAQRRSGACCWPWDRPSYHRSAAESGVVAHEYLSRLTRNARAVLVLRDVFEYSLREIADLTGVSANTAKDRLVRARQSVQSFVRRDRLTFEPPVTAR